MVEQTPGDQIQILLSDFNTRLKDLDERNKLIRERVLLLGKNLISSRQESRDELIKLKRENQEIKSDLDKIKRISNRLLLDSNKSVKRDEVTLLERMLKDFQPLEFMRKKDVEELIESKLLEKKMKKQINTPKITK